MSYVLAPPPSNMLIADPDCRSTALTNTPLGVKALQKELARLQWPAQKALLGDMKYCRTSSPMPAAAGVAMEVPVILRVPQEGPAAPLDRTDTRESPGATRSGLILWCNIMLQMRIATQKAAGTHITN